jgi:acyl-CoA thioesterase-1
MKSELTNPTPATPSTHYLARFHERIYERQHESSASPLVIVALGDSVTSGAGLPGEYYHEEVYHAQLRRMLNQRYPACLFNVINAGDDGRDAPRGVERLERDVLHHQPDLLLVGYSLNDAYGYGIEGLEQYGEALTTIVRRTREVTQASIVLLTPNMMPSRANDNVPAQYRELEPGFIRLQNDGVLAAYAQRVRDVGAAHAVAVADVYAAWEKLQQAGSDTTAMLVNGLNHPDTTGHRIAAECILQFVAIGV